MATTRTADQLLADLAELETTQVDKCPAHATHPSLPAVPCRIVEQKIVNIRFNGKVVVVRYHLHSYGYHAANNYNYQETRELKPTAAVKRQLEKFSGCLFSSIVEFKAILLDEPEQDESGAQVVSAAAVLDELKKNNFMTLGAQEIAENMDLGEFKPSLGIRDIRVENREMTIVKGYGADDDSTALRLRGDSYTEFKEEDYYEYVHMAPNACVRTILREAGYAGSYRIYKKTCEELLANQARLDKLNLLR
jgi:hypothetical protein